MNNSFNYNSFNKNKCYARLKSNQLKQCNHNKLHNCDYCKKHINYKDIPINKPLFNISFTNQLFDKQFYLNKDNFNIIKYITYSYSDNNIKNNILNNKYSKKNLINLYLISINKYNLYIKNVNKLILIQSIYRRHLIQKLNKLKGPALFKRKLSINDIDFYTCDNIEKIDYNYFISYKDSDNKIYSFDVRSLKLLITNSHNNPYNRNIIPLSVKDNVNLIYKNLVNKKKLINFEEETLTEEQLFNDKVINIFQKIDNFNYNTNINWFINLNIYKLKQLWILLEDIWNWRANLTPEDKYKIIQNQQVFKNFKNINNINNKKTLQNFILDDINILISNGVTRTDTSNGVIYVLMALSNISEDCGISFPWLIQTN